MNLKNSKNWSPMPRPHGYALALFLTLAAFAVRHGLQPHVAPYMPFQLFFVASLLAEYWAGLGPALLSAFLGLALGTHYFVAPYAEFDGISRSDVIVTINYAFVTLFSIVLVDYLRRTLYSNQLWLKIAQSRHRISLLRENDRLYLAKKARTAPRPVEKLLMDLSDVLILQVSGKAVYPQPLWYRLCALAGEKADDPHWMCLFHPDDRISLENALHQAGNAEAGIGPLLLRIRESGGEYRRAGLTLERIPVGGTLVIAVRTDCLG